MTKLFYLNLAVNDSKASGIYGLRPSSVYKRGGDIIIQGIRDKLEPPADGLLSKQKQKEAEKKFFSSKSHKLFYSVGCLVMPSVEFIRNIVKGSAPKRTLICEITHIDFSLEPPLFTLQGLTSKKTLPIRYYLSQLKPIVKKREAIDPKYLAVLSQRESRHAQLEIQIYRKGTDKKIWVNAEKYLMSPEDY